MVLWHIAPGGVPADHKSFSVRKYLRNRQLRLAETGKKLLQ